MTPDYIDPFRYCALLIRITLLCFWTLWPYYKTATLPYNGRVAEVFIFSFALGWGKDDADRMKDALTCCWMMEDVRGCTKMRKHLVSWTIHVLGYCHKCQTVIHRLLEIKLRKGLRQKIITMGRLAQRQGIGGSQARTNGGRTPVVRFRF